MKFTELNHQILAQILIASPFSAMDRKQSTIKESLLEMKSSPENSLEMEFLKDIFSLNTNEIIDKWYDANDTIVGFFFRDE